MKANIIPFPERELTHDERCDRILENIREIRAGLKATKSKVEEDRVEDKRPTSNPDKIAKVMAGYLKTISEKDVQQFNAIATMLSLAVSTATMEG